MKNYIRYILMLSLVATLFVGLEVTPQPAAEASPAEQGVGVGRVRFGNATVTGSPVRVQMDNQAIANMVFDLVGYFTFQSGERTVIFRREEGGAEIARTTFNLEPATRMTVTLVGTVNDPQIVVTNDDASPPVRGLTRIRVLNAVQGSSPAPVTLNGEIVADGVGYGTTTDEMDIQAGSYTVGLGDKQPADIVLSPGRYYLLVFAGGDDTASPRFIRWIGRPYRVSGFNRFRFMNLVEGPTEEDSPVYTVFVNQDPIPVYQNVDFGQATNEVVVQPGSYTFEVYNRGETPDDAEPVTTLQIDIEQDQSLFIVAIGEPGNVELQLFADDNSPVPVNTSRLQVINLSRAIPEFAVVGPNNVSLIDQAPFGSLVTNEIPGGAYNLGLVDANNPDSRVGRAEINAESGNLTTLVVYGTDQQRWLWFNEGLNQVASVRVAHASPDAGNVDIYLNGDQVLSDFAYQDATDYLRLDPGNYALEVYPAGTNLDVEEPPAPLWRDNLTITGNALAFTMVAVGSENFRVNVYADNLELIPDGQARIRFVNAVRNAQQVSFINAANAGVFESGVQFGRGTDNFNVNANTRTFSISGNEIGVFYRIESFALTPGGYYTFIVVGDAAEPDTVTHILLERVP